MLTMLPSLAANIAALALLGGLFRRSTARGARWKTSLPRWPFRFSKNNRYAVLAALLPKAACAAASRAIGTRNGEHDT